MPVDDRAIVSEHLVEIRYRALGKLVDIRGLIADWIADHTDLSYWSIADNRVDFQISENSDREKAFVTHRNLGYSTRSPDTRNYFPDRAIRFIRELLRVEGFELRPILRFGLRSRLLLPYDGQFESLLRRVNELMPLHEHHSRPFSAQVEDVGPIVVLRRGNIRIKFQSGPMGRDQARAMLGVTEQLPDTGFFMDIDQYQANIGPMNERDVATLVRSLNDHAWDAVDFYNRLLL